MKDLTQKREELIIRVGKCSDVVRGSVTSVCAKCSRAGCICDQKSPRRAYRLTYKDSWQKTRIVYVPRSRLPRIRKMIANYARLRQIIEQLVETNIEAFKDEARH